MLSNGSDVLMPFFKKQKRSNKKSVLNKLSNVVYSIINGNVQKTVIQGKNLKKDYFLKKAAPQKHRVEFSFRRLRLLVLHRIRHLHRL